MERPCTWSCVLTSYYIIVSTPDVCLGHDIGFLIFDEAHHAANRHAYNLIMWEFCDDLLPCNTSDSANVQ